MRMLSNTEAELKKSVAYKLCSQVKMPSIFGHAYIYDKHYMLCLKMKNILLGNNDAKNNASI